MNIMSAHFSQKPDLKFERKLLCVERKTVLRQIEECGEDRKFAEHLRGIAAQLSLKIRALRHPSKTS